MTRAEADRRVSEWHRDVATVVLVDPVYNDRRERFV